MNEFWARRIRTTHFSCLHQELAQSWFEAYLDTTPSQVKVCRFPLLTYEYIYDDLETMEQTGVVPASHDNEGRLVAVVGVCKPPTTGRKRDDARLRGWLGPTEKSIGKNWDKGHYIAHSIGGAVEQWEANVYPQKIRFNRGWSKAGKRYRQMESFCAANPGTLATQGKRRDRNRSEICQWRIGDDQIHFCGWENSTH